MNHDNVVIIWHVDKACHIGGASDGRGTERGPETEDPCGAPQRPGACPSRATRHKTQYWRGRAGCAGVSGEAVDYGHLLEACLG